MIKNGLKIVAMAIIYT